MRVRRRGRAGGAAEGEGEVVAGGGEVPEGAAEVAAVGAAATGGRKGGVKKIGVNKGGVKTAGVKTGGVNHGGVNKGGVNKVGVKKGGGRAGGRVGVAGDAPIQKCSVCRQPFFEITQVRSSPWLCGLLELPLSKASIASDTSSPPPLQLCPPSLLTPQVRAALLRDYAGTFQPLSALRGHLEHPSCTTYFPPPPQVYALPSLQVPLCFYCHDTAPPNPPLPPPPFAPCCPLFLPPLPLPSPAGLRPPHSSSAPLLLLSRGSRSCRASPRPPRRYTRRPRRYTSAPRQYTHGGRRRCCGRRGGGGGGGGGRGGHG